DHAVVDALVDLEREVELVGASDDVGRGPRDLDLLQVEVVEGFERLQAGQGVSGLRQLRLRLGQLGTESLGGVAVRGDGRVAVDVVGCGVEHGGGAALERGEERLNYAPHHDHGPLSLRTDVEGHEQGRQHHEGDDGG